MSTRRPSRKSQQEWGVQSSFHLLWSAELAWMMSTLMKVSITSSPPFRVQFFFLFILKCFISNFLYSHLQPWHLHQLTAYRTSPTPTFSMKMISSLNSTKPSAQPWTHKLQGQGRRFAWIRLPLDLQPLLLPDRNRRHELLHVTSVPAKSGPTSTKHQPQPNLFVKQTYQSGLTTSTSTNWSSKPNISPTPPSTFSAQPWKTWSKGPKWPSWVRNHSTPCYTRGTPLISASLSFLIKQRMPLVPSYTPWRSTSLPLVVTKLHNPSSSTKVPEKPTHLWISVSDSTSNPSPAPGNPSSSRRVPTPTTPSHLTQLLIKSGNTHRKWTTWGATTKPDRHSWPAKYRSYVNNQHPRGHVHHPANGLMTVLDLQSNTTSTVANDHERDFDTDSPDLQLILVDDEEDSTKKNLKKNEQKTQKSKKIRFYTNTLFLFILYNFFLWIFFLLFFHYYYFHHYYHYHYAHVQTSILRTKN